MFRSVAAAAALSFLAMPALSAPLDELLDAMGVPEVISIMRDEGLAHGEELGRDMIPGGSTAGWREIVSRIYDETRMLDSVRAGFAETLAETDLEPLLAFFRSEAGQDIVRLELSARRAMTDEDVEEAARGAFRGVEGTASPVLEEIREFVAVNDLVDANLVGALNANYMFYMGLVDGGALQMSEQEILAEVWSSEEETRADTREWVYAFLLMAYRPLEDGVVQSYTELSRTPEGRALNRALFDGFNGMYDDISYALGLSVARQMQVQDL